jgi:flavin-dependent dehydrogenase
LVTEEAATYYRKPNARAFREDAMRMGAPVHRFGRTVLVDRREFDEWILAQAERPSVSPAGAFGHLEKENQ